jgi:hypothetical protein
MKKLQETIENPIENDKKEDHLVFFFRIRRIKIEKESDPMISNPPAQ